MQVLLTLQTFLLVITPILLTHPLKRLLRDQLAIAPIYGYNSATES